MSLENDVRECLIQAIEDEFHQVLDAGDLNTAKPSDPDFKSDMVRWRHVLDRSCKCLKSRGYKPGTPSNGSAKDLLDVEMSQSLSYLVKLTPKKGFARRAPAALAAAAAFAVFSTIILHARRHRRGDGR